MHDPIFRGPGPMLQLCMAAMRGFKLPGQWLQLQLLTRQNLTGQRATRCTDHAQPDARTTRNQMHGPRTIDHGSRITDRAKRGKF